MVHKVKTLLDYARFGWGIGADVPSKRLLATLLLRSKWRDIIDRLDGRVHTASIHVGQTVFQIHFRVQDVFTIKEIFEDHSYLGKKTEGYAPSRILDLGANIGLASLLFKARFQDAQLYCVEPIEENYRLLVQNVSSLKEAHCYQVAVGPQDGEVELYYDPARPAAASFVNEPGLRAAPTKCRMRSLDSLLAEIGAIDFIKFDIEGAEQDVFASSALVQNVACIVGEMKGSREEVSRFFALFPRHDTEAVEVAPGVYIVRLRLT